MRCSVGCSPLVNNLVVLFFLSVPLQEKLCPLELKNREEVSWSYAKKQQQRRRSTDLLSAPQCCEIRDQQSNSGNQCTVTAGGTWQRKDLCLSHVM